MITWFRLYHDLPDCVKLRRFTPGEKWAWVVLLCLASKAKVRGVIEADHEDIADYCEFNTTQDWLYFRDKLIAKGMIEINPDGKLVILQWDEHQYQKPSDHPEAIKARVAKHRKKKQEKVKRDVTRYDGDTNADETTCIATDPDPYADPEKNIDIDHESQSTDVEQGDKSPSRSKKNSPKKKTTPKGYTPNFLIWWSKYYEFCQSISCEDKFVNAGSKQQAYDAWQKLFPDDQPSSDFLEGDEFYRQIKLGEFQKNQRSNRVDKGMHDVSHGCRYLASSDSGSKWQQALDFKRRKKIQANSDTMTAEEFEEFKRVAIQYGHKVREDPDGIGANGRFYLDEKVATKDRKILQILMGDWANNARSTA